MPCRLSTQSSMLSLSMSVGVRSPCYASPPPTEMFAPVNTQHRGSMDEYAAQRYTDAECEAVFADLLPQGFAGQDVLDDIAPAGWEQAALVATFHPSPEQVYEERVQFHRNLQSWSGRNQDRPAKPEPTRAEVSRDYQATPIETEREVRELVGQCLWDIFSDNHDVLGPDGRLVDIGSFRGAGGFLADCLNRQSSSQEYDYMDFYMGTIWLSRRAA